jgi:antitoxin YefM
MVAASELRGLLETAHLLRSPANARRLLQALRRALGHKGTVQTVADLRAELGLE